MTRSPGAAPGVAGPAARLLLALERHGWTVAVAESLTGGLVAASLVDVPGASRALRGGIVAYATDLKASLLDVDAGLLEARGAVDPDVAASMAEGVRLRLAADVGLATTGVAGPDPQDGKAPGTVYVAVAGPGLAHVARVDVAGDRAEVRAQACAAVIALALAHLDPAG
ncbi:CinA family protein [Cellulomonas timonensis]|uniref:CinA family protein n=1 Tax=Cellulomonas timonensis TaxID=1689271 RepID=UPI0008375286|nr:CinA family protein [Cellulomonas timonensis]